MPTLSFYVNDEVAMQLEKVIKKQSSRLGFVVSRGDIIVPHIKKLYKREFPNGNGAHYIGKELSNETGEGTTSAEVKE